MSSTGGTASFRSTAPMERCAEFLAGPRDVLFVLGVVLAFVGQAFPYGFPLFLPVAILSLIFALADRVWVQGVGSIVLPVNWVTVALLAAIACYLYGVLRTARLENLLFFDMANVFGMFVLYVCLLNSANSRTDLDRLVRRALRTLIVAGGVVGAISCYKLVLMIRGQQLEFVAAQSSAGYPWGTSLVTDYNMFALVILSCLLAATVPLVYGRTLRERLLGGCMVLFFLFVGSLAGSRRFWLVAPLSMAFMMAIGAWRSGGGRLLSTIGILAAILGLIVIMILSVPGALTAIEDLSDVGMVLQNRVFSLLESQGGYGMDPRFDRWELAADLMNGSQFLDGSGFDYLYLYGCRFAGCGIVDYPHNPLMSAVLYAGLPGLISAALLMGAMVLVGWRVANLPSTVAGALGTAMLAHVLFLLISSNTIFSVKSLLVTFLLCLALSSDMRRRDSLLP